MKLRWVMAAAFLLAGWKALQAEPFQPLPIVSRNFRLLPESERSLQRLVIGLEADSTQGYMVSGEKAKSPLNKERLSLLRRELFMLHFELVHGNLMRVLPTHTHLYVATPDPEFVHNSLGNEPALFADYLKIHAGWTEKQVQARVSFFKVRDTLLFPQDMAEILGRDREERLVLGVGEDSFPVYRKGADELASRFPGDFQICPLPGLNTEGGDTELVWRPDGSIGVLVGQTRIRRYLETEKRLDLRGRVIPPDWIASAKEAFSQGFFGVKVLILGLQELQNPDLISPEVFHIDMVANILRNGKQVMAFVPSYGKNPVDAFTSQPLGPAIVQRAQHFYDEAASQLKAEGYEIIRLPFSDHPVRNPVNVGKFTSPASGQATIFLSRYPYHYPLAGEKVSMQAQLQEVLYAMDDGIDLWREKPTDGNWAALQKTLQSVWEEFGKVEASSNPIFDSQEAIYRKHGIGVIPVVIYPSSEGGIHCLLLK